MALQVWLPLNGNINNQGLSNVTVSLQNGTIAYSSNGKIGSCFYNCSTGSNLTIPYTSYVTNQLSITFWVKPNSPSAWMDLFSIGAYANRMETDSSSGGMYYWFNDDNSYALIASSSSLFGLADGIWHHIAVTLDGTNAKFYVNGILKKTLAQVNSLEKVMGGNNNIFLGRRRPSESSYYQGYFNDFRIYDHCLSAKEVAEIAKGLVLHYPLNNGGFGAPNLVKNSLMKTTSSTYGFEIRDVTVESGKQYTFSVNGCISDAAKNDGTTLKVYLYKNDWSYCPLILSISNTTNTTVTGTFTANQSTTLKITSYSFLSQGTAGSPVTINWYKLEEGSKSTPWCPNSADSLYSSLGFNSNIESDCSGFGNNGTRSGGLIYNSNSMRYSGCLTFEAKSHIKIAKPMTISNASQFTVAMWVKPESGCGGYAIVASNYNNPSSGFWMAINTEGSGTWFYNGTYAKGNALLTVGSWSHIAMVFNVGVITWYVNGTATTTSDVSSRTTQFTDYIAIGNSYTGSSWNTNFVGRISDFRMYGTALSTAQVKELYSVPQSIDKNGNLYAYEYREV